VGIDGVPGHSVFSKRSLFVTLIILDTEQNNTLYAECCYAECRILLIVMLRAVILSVVILNVIMLSVIMFCVVAPMIRGYIGVGA